MTKTRKNWRGGFTLVEVLAAQLLIAITLLAVMRGFAGATAAGSMARRRTEATGLAESILNQIVTSGQWQNGSSSGDFGPDWPGYHWQLLVQPWQADTSGQGIQQLDLSVLWTERNHDDSLRLSTLAYVRPTSAANATQ